MDYFDLAADYGGVLANAFKGTPTRFCVVSFTSDWLFPTSDSRAIVHALNAGRRAVSFAEIETDKGHDAFLLDEPELFAIVRGFLDRRRRGARAGGRAMMLLRPKRDLTMAEAARAPAARASTFCWSPRWSSRGSRVLDVGCGDGELLRLLRDSAASTGAASSSRARA